MESFEYSAGRARVIFGGGTVARLRAEVARLADAGCC